MSEHLITNNEPNRAAKGINGKDQIDLQKVSHLTSSTVDPQNIVQQEIKPQSRFGLSKATLSVDSLLNDTKDALLVTALLILMAVVLAGCSKRYSDLPAFSAIPIKDYANESVGRFKTSYLADQIDSYYRGIDPGPIGITTLVNIDDLYTTSTFGRIYSEQLMSELVMRGYDVVELRHSDALQFMNTGGEFALSRDVTTIRRERKLGGLIVGTYVASPVRVYVNSRLIDPSTSLVLSAGSVEMPKTSEITKLLRSGSGSATLERIPVRHLGQTVYPMYGMPNMTHPEYDREEAGIGAGRSERLNVEPMLPSSKSSRTKSR